MASSPVDEENEEETGDDTDSGLPSSFASQVKRSLVPPNDSKQYTRYSDPRRYGSTFAARTTNCDYCEHKRQRSDRDR